MHSLTPAQNNYRRSPLVLLGPALAFCLTVGLTAGDSFAQSAGSSYIHPSGGKTTVAPRVAALGAVAAADSPSSWIYHNGSTLVCSDCHTMHASQQHQYDPAAPADPFGSTPRTFTPAARLLKAADPVTLCTTCHDGRAGIPDVITADSNNLAQRSAGFFDLADVPNYRGHNLKTGLSSNPNDLCSRCHFGGPHGGGSFGSAGVSCGDCHEVHGNGRVRNLRWASWPGGEPAAFGLFMANSALGNMSRYEAANVGYGSDNTGNLREATNMCLDCHHVFSGPYYTDSDGNGIHERHPTYDSERNAINSIAQGAGKGSTDPAHWQNGTGAGFNGTPRVRFVNNGATSFALTQLVDASKNGVFCLSCHKAHGSQYAFSLTWNPTGPAATAVCEQCHYKTGL